jgi:hypothetical protein
MKSGEDAEELKTVNELPPRTTYFYDQAEDFRNLILQCFLNSSSNKHSLLSSWSGLVFPIAGSDPIQGLVGRREGMPWLHYRQELPCVG